MVSLGLPYCHYSKLQVSHVNLKVRIFQSGPCFYCITNLSYGTILKRLASSLCPGAFLLLSDGRRFRENQIASIDYCSLLEKELDSLGTIPTVSAYMTADPINVNTQPRESLLLITCMSTFTLSSLGRNTLLRFTCGAFGGNDISRSLVAKDALHPSRNTNNNEFIPSSYVC